jgi:hypothetical protein
MINFHLLKRSHDDHRLWNIAHVCTVGKEGLCYINKKGDE